MNGSTSAKSKVLILYTELAQYIVSCIERFVERNEAEVLIIRWPVNKEAPFNFNFSDKVKVLTRSDLSDTELNSVTTEFSPDIVVSSGWVDKGYLSVCRSFKKQGKPTVMCTDTKWVGNWKQRAATALSPFIAHRSYTDIWTTGQKQGQYARKLGFKEDHIHYGFYSADALKYEKNRSYLESTKAEHYPKRFLYMGRYIASKGIVELINAFIELQSEAPNDWELWCCGTGELDPLPMKHDKVKHFGFVQVKDVPYFIEQTGVFVLPSHFEPWGVVVHEMALSGMPMLLSSEIGAAEMFLEEGKNGRTFTSGNSIDLKQKLKLFMAKTDQELMAMGKESARLGLKHDPDKWSSVLENILERERGNE